MSPSSKKGILYPDNRHDGSPKLRLARRAGPEVELFHAIDVVDPISRLLNVRVDVCKPPNPAARSILEILAVVFKQLIVFLQSPRQVGRAWRSRDVTYMLASDASDCIRAVGLNTCRCDGGPAILRQAVKEGNRPGTLKDRPGQSTSSFRYHAR